MHPVHVSSITYLWTKVVALRRAPKRAGFPRHPIHPTAPLLLLLDLGLLKVPPGAIVGRPAGVVLDHKVVQGNPVLDEVVPVPADEASLADPPVLDVLLDDGNS